MDKYDAIDATLAEAIRMATLAVELLGQVKVEPGGIIQRPLPRVRAMTLLRCAVEVLGDMDR